MLKQIDKVVVLAYGSPLANSGYGIALEASIRQYARLAENVHFICISDMPVNMGTLKTIQNISAVWIPIKRLPVPIRFLEGLVRRLPAIGIQYRKSSVMRALKEELQNVGNTRSSVIVFEDVPIALLAEKLYPLIKKKTTKVVLRSHNVMSKAFIGLLGSVSPLMRVFWKWEIAKLYAWEIQSLRRMDAVWAISSADMEEYHRLLGFKCHGVLGLELDIERYRDLPIESADTIVYIGSTDIRKRAGLQLFIKKVWPRLRAQIPEARFILAGADTEAFSDSVNGVHGLGRVDDDRPILAKGQIFVNPQDSGTGVKLKSIIAMAAGRTLVSTNIGLEGVVGNNGEHFVSVSSVLEMFDQLITLMKDRRLANNIGVKARQIAAENYSIGSLDGQVDELFRELLNDVSVNDVSVVV